jgi:hypothetical protein
MIAVVCKSACLAQELTAMAQDETVATFASEISPDADWKGWLAETLAGGRVRAVLFEPRFFVDPAPFRAASPDSRFVVMCAPGDEGLARDALARGARAILEKPVDPKEFRSVLSLVSG